MLMDELTSAQARYFPVTPGPLKMTAGLRRLGTDFGQGTRDQQLFQVDRERPRYLAAKRTAPAARHVISGDDEVAEHARAAGLACMRAALTREAPALLAEANDLREARDPLEALALVVQEDFAILCAGEAGEGRMVALDVRFPSGWRPERLAGGSFASIHAPVPDFVDSTAAARSMVEAMVMRGPYVRFVWALCTDTQLDHHPDVRPASTWSDLESWQLRIERQVTVPLPHVRASVFLIRTYLYPWHTLATAQQTTLLSALSVMPRDIRAYKGLPTSEEVASALAGSQLRRR